MAANATTRQQNQFRAGRRERKIAAAADYDCFKGSLGMDIN